jgi:hypothetical protein
MKADEHSQEMIERALRRAERQARSSEEGPTPHKGRPERTSTDVDAVKAAHDKRERKKLRQIEEAARTREGKR